MGLICSFTPEDIGYPREVVEYASDGTVVSQEVDYTEACNAFVRTFMAVSTTLVPVDTGYLRSTLACTTDSWEVTAITRCEYAQYVEYGTWCCRAQPYFTPAIEQAFLDFCEEADLAYEEAYEWVMEEIEMIEEELEEEAEMMMSSMGGMGGLGGLAFLGIGLIVLFPLILFAYGISQSIGLVTGSSRDLARDAIPRNERVHGWNAYEQAGGGAMPLIEII